jgi:hypothetical protein
MRLGSLPIIKSWMDVALRRRGKDVELSQTSLHKYQTSLSSPFFGLCSYSILANQEARCRQGQSWLPRQQKDPWVILPPEASTRKVRL